MNDDTAPSDPRRRQLLRAGAALAGAAAVAGAIPKAFAQTLPSVTVTYDDLSVAIDLPEPSQSGIEHVVVVTMENRSFDHFMGWVPGARGKQAGLIYPDAFGNRRSTFPLASSPTYRYQGCNHADPDHSYAGARLQYNNGRCDGWLMTPDTNKTNSDLLPIGYYTEQDLPFFSGCAHNWTICDNYMPGIMAETYPNRFYLMSGETDRLINDTSISQLPTIFDRFNAKGIASKYYYSDIPFTSLYGTRLLKNSFSVGQFLVDAQSGTLPAFSMIDPRFAGEAQGTSGDDHPVSDIRDGQAFLNRIYDAVRTSPNWPTTLFVVVYDEWGGFFDHVPPQIRPVSYYEKALGNDGRLGFRVPFVLIGPRVKRNNISGRQYDPSSIHKFLMWRFGLDPLGVRSTDKATNSIALSLDFKHAPNLYAPTFAVPVGPFGSPCAVSGTETSSLEALAPLAKQLGFAGL